MLKIHAHDIINDITLIETSFSFNIRYGLEVKEFMSLHSAIVEFQNCQFHALASNLEKD